jgi:selT/selW/selH-like putative selenoprotein
MDVIDSHNSWHFSQSRGMACSAGLGRAPPKKVSIEFDPNDVEDFIKLADAIEAAFPSVIVEGNEEKEGRRGSFEIQTEDGIAIWSRLTLSTSSLPGTQDIINRIANRANLGKSATDEANKPFCG